MYKKGYLLIKPGVNVVGLQEEVWKAAYAPLRVFNSFSVDCVITSGLEGKHTAKHSDHYTGCAVDFRIRDLRTDIQAEEVARRLQEVFGKDYLVICELAKQHIHVSWRPLQGEAVNV